MTNDLFQSNEERITLYAIAAMRVEREPDLLPFRETILHEEWTEADEHWTWVIDAPVEEIVAWAATIGKEGKEHGNPTVGCSGNDEGAV